jgi:hypothetical protein
MAGNCVNGIGLRRLSIVPASNVLWSKSAPMQSMLDMESGVLEFVARHGRRSLGYRG